MRNHLAEEVLNADMLHLMGMYQKSLGGAGTELTATMELLKNTSVLIKNIRDKSPIVDFSDDRLKQNHDAMDFFINWENQIMAGQSVKKGNMFDITPNKARHNFQYSGI